MQNKAHIIHVLHSVQNFMNDYIQQILRCMQSRRSYSRPFVCTKWMSWTLPVYRPLIGHHGKRNSYLPFQ